MMQYLAVVREQKYRKLALERYVYTQSTLESVGWSLGLLKIGRRGIGLDFYCAAKNKLGTTHGGNYGGGHEGFGRR
jgi:hypothetical protein